MSETETEFDNRSMSSSFEPDFSDITNDRKRSANRDYRREYMRDYRIKQKQKQDEQKHYIFIHNQACNHKEVEDLLLKALSQLINVINTNISLISEERIERLNDVSDNIIKYGQLLVSTVDELINNCENKQD